MATTTTRPPDRYGRQWGDPNYGADAPTKKKKSRPPDAYGRPYGDPNYGKDPTPKKSSKAPAPAQQGPSEEQRLQADYDQRQKFLDEELALLQKEREQMEADYERQKAYFEQDAALSEQERALALQELETQLNYQRQQLELRRQQAQSDLDEEKRQAPLRLRDIADQFASQGAYFSGRRAFAQEEATIASNLAIQGLERQLRSEEMSVEEAEALAAIKRGQFGLDAQRQALESENRLASLRADIDLRFQRGDLDYRERSYELKQALEEEKRKLTDALTGGGGKDLSKDDLGTMLRQGIITKNQFYKGLTAQGYSKDQAKALYLSEMAKGPYGGSGGTGTKLSVSQLGTMLRQGLIDQKTYQKALKGKGYSATEAKAMYASESAKGPYGGGRGGGKTVTKGDVTTAVREGLMSPEEGYKTLRALGYNDGSARLVIANAQKAKQDSAASAARRSSGKDLTKTDWLSLYRNKMISEGELIKGLKSLGYSTEEAKALAANVNATKARSSGGLNGQESIRAGESLISPTRIHERNPGTFLRTYWDEFTRDFEDVQNYVKQTTGNPSLAGYLNFLKKQYLAADDRHTEKGFTATVAKWSKTISFAWYFYFYGGGLGGAQQMKYTGG